MNIINKIQKSIFNFFEIGKEKLQDFFVSKNFRIAKAIVECDEEKLVNLLKNNKANESIFGIPFLQIASLNHLAFQDENIENYLSDNFKTKFKAKHKKDFSTSEQKEKSASIIRLLIDKGANVNESYFGIITDKIIPTIKYLSTTDLICASGDESLISLFISKGANLEKNNKINLTSLDMIAFQDNAKSLFKKTGKFKTDEEIENTIKTLRAKVIIGLSYSERSDGLLNSLISKVIEKSLENADFEKKEIISEVINKSSYNKNNKDKVIELPNQNKIKIHNISYKDHAAFALIECDKNNKLLTLTYCDGNNKFKANNGEKYTFGSLTFKLNDKKIELLRKKIKDNKSEKKSDLDVVEDYLKKSFRLYSSEVYGLFADGKKFDKILSKLVECKDKKPIIFEKNIPTKSQKRGNCALKSTNILVREILRKSDKKMVFYNEFYNENEFWRISDDNKQTIYPAGEGYIIYKNYKENLIKKPIDNLIELATPENKDKFFYNEVVNTLKLVYLKAAEKSRFDFGFRGRDTEIFEKIDNIFTREKIDYKNVIKEKYNGFFYDNTSIEENVISAKERIISKKYLEDFLEIAKSPSSTMTSASSKKIVENKQREI